MYILPDRGAILQELNGPEQKMLQQGMVFKVMRDEK